jgi:hypothetical protein
MAPKKRYESAAARQAAYRERQAQVGNEAFADLDSTPEGERPGDVVAKKTPESKYSGADALGRAYGEAENLSRAEHRDRGVTTGLDVVGCEQRIQRAIGYQRFLVDSGRDPA